MSWEIGLLRKMKSYRRAIGVFLMILMLVSTSSAVLQAEDNLEKYQKSKMEHEEAINKLFDEMNELTLQKIMVSEKENVAKVSEALKSDIQEKLEKIDAELEELGVRRIDTNNPRDREILDEMPVFPINDAKVQSGIYDDAPTLLAIVDYYTIYIYDGEYTCNSGRTYSHRKIYVHDGAGLELTQLKTYDLGVVKKPCVLKDLLGYNFQYGISQLLAKVSYGAVLDWALGNVITVLKSYDGNAGVTIHDGNSAYRADVGTQTEMRYFYVYDGSWKLIGNAATVWVSRFDEFVGVINGQFVKKMADPEKWNASNGQSYWQYIESYDLTGRNNNNFMLSFPLGSFDVKGMSETYTIVPPFYKYPGEIIIGKPGE